VRTVEAAVAGLLVVRDGGGGSLRNRLSEASEEEEEEEEDEGGRRAIPGAAVRLHGRAPAQVRVRLVEVLPGPRLRKARGWAGGGMGSAYPSIMSSLEKLSFSVPSSCRYMQSGFVQGTPRRKYEQYLVVPKEDLRSLPSSMAPSVAWIAAAASSLRANVI
jgi:hypothetical protein